MKTNGREDSGRYGIILGSEVILKVDPQASSPTSDQASPEPLDTRRKTDQSVVLSTAHASERALLALVDGRRTVQELVRLAGMSDLVVRRHLRALCERGILVPTNLATMPPVAAGESPADPAAPERTGIRGSSGEVNGDGLSKALTEYLDSGRTAVVQGSVSDAITAKAVAGSGPVGGPALSGGAGSGPPPPSDPPASKVAVGAGSSGPSMTLPPPEPQLTFGGASGEPPGESGAGKRALSPPAGVIAGEWPRRSKTPSSFKPNVTAFWIPSPSDPAPAGSSSAPGGASRAGVPAPVAAPAPASPPPPAAPPSASASPPAAPAAPSPLPATTMIWTKAGPSAGVAGAVRPMRPPSPPQGTVIVSGSASPPDTDSVNLEAVPGSVGAGGSRGRSAPIPFRLGEYEVATRIAQGGMGSIYVCRRAGAAGAQRLFTLKVVRQHAKQVTQVVQSFRREARVGALLSHPNLQTVVHVGTYHEQPFLILDYVEGIGLAELMASHKRLPPAIVVSILVDVLRGLKVAHDLVDEQGTRLGLVHGDVSPQNILVGVDGNARLTDFGSARFLSDARAPEAAAPVLMGKPAFMSPEQLCADPIDARTDLFSLGVVMWTALTGQSLFVADSYDQIVMNIFRKKIPPPSEFGAPACFDEISTTALSRAPDGRYTSAEEMANALSRVARAEGIVGSPYDVGQWVRREFAETLAERKRRVQVVFGGAGASASSASTTGGAAVASAAPVDAASAAGAEKHGASSADGYARLPSRTVQLSAFPHRRTTPRLTTLGSTASEASRRARWRVVVISAAIAFPFALTLAYLATNPLVRRLRAPRPSPPAGAAEAARPGRQAGGGPVGSPAPAAVQPTPAPSEGASPTTAVPVPVPAGAVPAPDAPKTDLR